MIRVIRKVYKSAICVQRDAVYRIPSGVPCNFRSSLAAFYRRNFSRVEDLVENIKKLIYQSRTNASYRILTESMKMLSGYKKIAFMAIFRADFAVD
jgi:hypothetical protein